MKLGHRQILVTIFSLALLACFGACSKNSKLQECKDESRFSVEEEDSDLEAGSCGVDEPTPTPDPWYTPTPTPSPTPAASSNCSNLSVSLVKVNPMSDVYVGSLVTFEVTVLNCPKYRIERLDGAAPAVLELQKVRFDKTYSYPSASMSEGVRIIGLDSAGHDTKIVSATASPFAITINPQTDPANQLSCTVTPDFSTINVPVNVFGWPTAAWPTVTFTVHCNRRAQVVRAENLSGSYTNITGLPTPIATDHTILVSLGFLGRNEIAFKMVDEQFSTNTTSPKYNIYLNPVFPQ